MVEVESTRRQKTRERLMDAAYLEFSERGVPAASVEAVSERAGFTRGAFYSNFSSKEELFFALMERENLRRVEALGLDIASALPNVSDDPSALTEELVGEVLERAFGGQALDRRWCLVQEEFALLAMRNTEVAAEYNAFQADFFDRLAHVVRTTLADAGLALTGDPRDVVKLLSGVYEFALRESLLEPDAAASTNRMLSLVPQIVLALLVPLESEASTP